MPSSTASGSAPDHTPAPARHPADHFFKNLTSETLDTVYNAFGISSPSKVMQRIGAFTAEGFARGIADGVPLATRAADRLATAATFDSVRADLANAPGTGSTSPVTFRQIINATPDQSP